MPADTLPPECKRQGDLGGVQGGTGGGLTQRVLEIVWFCTKIVSIRYNCRLPWGQTILKKDGVDKSSSRSKYSSNGDGTRDEPPVGGIETQERRRDKCPERGEPADAKAT